MSEENQTIDDILQVVITVDSYTLQLLRDLSTTRGIPFIVRPLREAARNILGHLDVIESGVGKYASGALTNDVADILIALINLMENLNGMDGVEVSNAIVRKLERLERSLQIGN